MTDPRTAILGRLGQVLGHATDPDDTAVGQRLHAHGRGPQPQWSEPVRDRFLGKLTKASASHAEIDGTGGIITAVADYLRWQNLPTCLAAAPHPLLAGLAWPEAWQVASRHGQGDDRVGLGVAFCGIAETGSLMLLSGPESPTTLNFLPDDFLCLLPASRILPRMEDAWDLLRAERGAPPRAVNIISGPSRTADVEQTIQLGAHGPRRLHVLLLQDSA
jgi:hypothetical protein